MPRNNLYIGILSGTSADSIDATLVDFESGIKILGNYSLTMPQKTKKKIFQLVFKKKGKNFDKDLFELDMELGKLFSKVILKLLKKYKIPANQIAAIGCHGQTIKHNAFPKKPYSLQVANSEIIKKITNIKVISGFRQSDIENGGAGAPLTPAFHNEFFSSNKKDRAIINIGGITNITLLPRNKKIKGWDIGPGNCLIDQAIKDFSKNKLQFDLNGNYARKGDIKKLKKTISNYLRKSYFNHPIPKSQSIENYKFSDFNIHKLERKNINKYDIIAALTEITFLSIKKDIEKYCKKGTEIFFCGGGSKNCFLISKFQNLQEKNYKFKNTADLNIDPMKVEALAFAWLAMKRNSKQKLNLKAVTGSKKSLIGKVI